MHKFTFLVSMFQNHFSHFHERAEARSLPVVLPPPLLWVRLDSTRQAENSRKIDMSHFMNDLSGMDDEEMEQRQMELESDYEMGIAFHERIVPHAIKWFTGEADDEDDGDDDYEEDEDEDGDLDVSFTC